MCTNHSLTFNNTGAAAYGLGRPGGGCAGDPPHPLPVHEPGLRLMFCLQCHLYKNTHCFCFVAVAFLQNST